MSWGKTSKIRVFNEAQRASIHADTHIDPLILADVAAAYEALVNREDVVEYRRRLLDAMARQGLPVPTPEEFRPTAVDRAKTLAVTSISDQWGWDVPRVRRWIQQLASP